MTYRIKSNKQTLFLSVHQEADLILPPHQEVVPLAVVVPALLDRVVLAPVIHQAVRVGVEVAVGQGTGRSQESKYMYISKI